jgi:hypothetical protein
MGAGTIGRSVLSNSHAGVVMSDGVPAGSTATPAGRAARYRNERYIALSVAPGAALAHGQRVTRPERQHAIADI